jgi:hypothetical protein
VTTDPSASDVVLNAHAFFFDSVHDANTYEPDNVPFVQVRFSVNCEQLLPDGASATLYAMTETPFFTSKFVNTQSSAPISTFFWQVNVPHEHSFAPV